MNNEEKDIKAFAKIFKLHDETVLFMVSQNMHNITTDQLYAFQSGLTHSRQESLSIIEKLKEELEVANKAHSLSANNFLKKAAEVTKLKAELEEVKKIIYELDQASCHVNGFLARMGTTGDLWKLVDNCQNVKLKFMDKLEKIRTNEYDKPKQKRE